MKTFCLSLCLIFLISISHAQKVYFKLGGGYGLPVATQTIGENYFQTYDGNTQEYTTTEESVSASFGSGININGGAGIMFSKYLGLDLNFQYLAGKSYEMIDRETYVGGFTGKEERVRTIHANAIYINPSLVISPGAGAMMPYGRFGVVISSPKIKGEESYYYDLDGTETEEREFELKKGTAFGFQGAVGFNFAIMNSLDIYAEVNFIGMTYYPKEYELTMYTNDGDDRLDDLNVRDKKTEFKKEITNEEQPSQDEPRQELRVGMPFSSISLQVGVKFTLGGRETE